MAIERKMVSSAPIEKTCLDCNVKYMANKVTYDNGDVVITPPRCPACQTAHVTNLRVDKTIKDIRLLGNLKQRLTMKQRQAIIEVLNLAVVEVRDRYNSEKTVTSGFDLRKVQ